jgi:hypothetical protein
MPVWGRDSGLSEGEHAARGGEVRAGGGDAMKDAIIVDLDGTLYNCEERRKKYLSDPPKPDFDGFNAAAVLDEPSAWCVALVRAISMHGYEIVFVTGREETHRKSTNMWIQAHEILAHDRKQRYRLLMRPAGDFRPDEEIKRELYAKYIRGEYEVLFVIDDRKKVVDMWRSLGLVALHCAEGNF